MDQFDRAQALEQRYREAAISNARTVQASEQTLIGGVVVCEDCNTPIPPKRLQIVPNATRCIGCQQKAEKQR